jgi:hypothetical protein
MLGSKVEMSAQQYPGAGSGGQATKSNVKLTLISIRLVLYPWLMLGVIPGEVNSLFATHLNLI